VMKDGRRITCDVEYARGSPGNPLTRDELVAKYRGCASRAWNAERLERSIGILENLEAATATELGTLFVA
jgi:2-methylcitrate dehydratase PrpD